MKEMMNKYWSCTYEYDIFIRFYENKVYLTIPEFDVYDKEAIKSNVDKIKCEFCYNNLKYKSTDMDNEKITFSVTSNSNEKQQCLIFRPIYIAEYKRVSQKIDRRELLKVEYLNKRGWKESFSYEYTDIRLQKLREKCDVDSWIDKSSGIATVQSILIWISNNISHNGFTGLPVDQSAYKVLDFARQKENQLNCKGLAIIAMELCLLMKLKVKLICCIQKEVNVIDSHYVISVYIEELDKWIMADPSYCVIIYDSLGNPLSIPEIRRCLATNKETYLSDNANCGGKKLNKILYLRSLIKKFYRFYTLIETKVNGDYEDNRIMLAPKNMEYPDLNCIDTPDDFWK